MGLLIRLVISALAVWASTALPGIDLGNVSTGQKALTIIVVAVIFGVVNAVLKPIIKTLGCALYVLTLGLIALVVNALLFWLTSWIADQLHFGFHVDGFVSAFLGALVVSIVTWLLSVFVKDE